MKCPNCGEAFTPQTVVQKYCSRRCGRMFRAHHGSSPIVGYPSIEFTCAKCGRRVVTDGIRDKRSRFCSAVCEKNYWRHPPQDEPACRQNFRSISAYLYYERKTNV